MIKPLLLCFALLYALTGCSQKQSHSKEGTQIVLVSPKDFSKLLSSEKGILLDVRTPGEWKKGHIKDALHLDIFRDDFEIELTKLDTNITVYVYCAAGGRSSEAAEMMLKKGFSKVVDMDGGLMRWKNEGLPIEQ